ncbi:MAG: HAD family hydrolase [Maritimibacter sp.]
MTLKAVLFDCDGVLVDSEPAAFELIGEELAAHGLHLSHEELEAHFVGGTIHIVFEKSRAMGADLPDGWVDHFYEKLYARLAKGTALFPGVEALLDALDWAGIKYAVGSNGTQRKMRTTLGQHLSVWDRLQGNLFSGQELGCPKPDPALYLTAAKSLGVAPENCVVVDDSATGCQGGLNAKMRTIGFASGKREGLDALGIEVARDMSELRELLGI